MNKTNGILGREFSIVPGAKFTFTVSAIIEGIWFGLGLLLIPGILYQLAFIAEPTLLELYLFRSIGVLALALAIGCLSARNGDKSTALLMSKIMVIAKGGSTVVLIAMMYTASAELIGYINPFLTAILFLLNLRQLKLLS